MSNLVTHEDLIRLSALLESEFDRKVSNLSRSSELTLEIRSDAPVSDTTRADDQSRLCWYRLRLYQQIALCLVLLKTSGLSEDGRLRLAWLQEYAPLECIQKALQTTSKAFRDKRLRNTLLKAGNFANSAFRPSRKTKKRMRDRVRGYRDKGTLTDVSTSARRAADSSNFIYCDSLKNSARAEQVLGILEFLSGMYSFDIWVDETVSLEKVRELGKLLTRDLRENLLANLIS